MTMSQPKFGSGVGNDAALAAAVEEVISDLSRLRARIDSLGLPLSEARTELSTHLTLASMAALRLRFSQGEDDVVAE
jgi:hypothetical protein